MLPARLLQLFQNPEHAGELPQPDARVESENPVCGDQLVLTARVAAEGRLEVRFLARGCVASMAVAEALCKMLESGGLAEAGQITRKRLDDEVGGLSSPSTHATALATEACARLLRQLWAPPSSR